MIFDKKTVIEGEISFNQALVNDVSFQKAKTDFIPFEGARIYQIEFSWDANVAGLSFRGAKFIWGAECQEACRVAKDICEDAGDREEADYYSIVKWRLRENRNIRLRAFLSYQFNIVSTMESIPRECSSRGLHSYSFLHSVTGLEMG